MSDYLIPIAYINEACNFSENIDEKEIKPSIEEAQEDLKSVLGAEFYAEIESQYPSTFTTANETLYEGYLKKFIAWQAYFYHLGFAQSKSTPTGERVFNDDNSALLADVQMAAKEKNVRRRSEKYKAAIIDFLRLEQSKDSTAYPKWAGYCADTFGFGISGIGKDIQTANIFSVNKATVSNQ